MENKNFTSIEDRNKRLQVVVSLIELYESSYDHHYNITLVPCTKDEYGYIEVHSSQDEEVMYAVHALANIVEAVPFMSMLPFADSNRNVYFLIH